MLQWSEYFQVPEYLEATRMFLLSSGLRPSILHVCQLEKGAQILDVGCGTGYFTRFLADGSEDFRLSGIDSQENFILYAREEAARRNLDISFLTGDALRLPFPDDYFDAVVSHTFLTSIDDAAGALEEMRRVCKKDGHLCSITAMSFVPQLVHPGHYPPQCLWHDAYTRLSQKLQTVYDRLNPLNGYVTGIPTAELPTLFASKGLKDVVAYPLGKLFSLSNAAFSVEDRKKYLELDYRASLKRLGNFESVPGFSHFITKDEITTYYAVLAERQRFLLGHLDDNAIWEWNGGANCLIVGRNDKAAGEAVAGESPAIIDLKFKDSRPEDTVRRIKGILEGIGITTSELWIESHVPHCYSVRVTIQGTGVGQNGKGMTKALALASGYAELMERLQTGYCYMARQDPETATSQGFAHVPGEVYLGIEEILARDERWFDSLYQAIIPNVTEFLSKRAFLGFLAYRSHPITDKPFIGVPFYNYDTGEKVLIPTAVLHSYYATNGTCAGNSQDEAIVQGLSEIVERHRTLKIRTTSITPPDVPEYWLQRFPVIHGVILTIRSNPRYTVLVKDCSLGEGYPVVATVLIDRERHGYCVKFGAHPVFEIALERSMTELFQGRTLENAAMIGTLLYSTAEAQKADIVHNALKNATGPCHYRFFERKADYDFIPPEDRSAMTNQELCQFALSFFRDRDLDVYIRNASYLGFPTYQILIPSFSEAYNSGILRLKELKTHQQVIGTLSHFSQASPEEIRRLMIYLKYKESFALENTAAFLMSLPLSSEADFKYFEILSFIACLKGGKLARAIELSTLIFYVSTLPDEKAFFGCFAMLLKLIQAGSDAKTARTPLECFHDTGIVGRVLDAFANPDLLLERYGIQCDFRCAACPSTWLCEYPKLKDALLKLKEAFRRAPPLGLSPTIRGIVPVFSAREKEVGRYYIEGFSRKEIAEKLFISENTVKKHLDSIYRKVGTDQRKEVFAAIKAVLGKQQGSAVPPIVKTGGTFQNHPNGY